MAAIGVGGELLDVGNHAEQQVVGSVRLVDAVSWR
jgi:hypothetical protein